MLIVSDKPYTAWECSIHIVSTASMTKFKKTRVFVPSKQLVFCYKVSLIIIFWCGLSYTAKTFPVNCWVHFCFIVGPSFRYSTLKNQSKHILWNATVVSHLASELVVAGRTREGDIVFLGDVVFIQCMAGFEFDFKKANLSITVTSLGFVGMKPCNRKLNTAVMCDRLKVY